MLTRLVNLSIMTSRYPKSWKFGVISPVPKGGDLMDQKNWRPVTLLCCMSKVLEGALNRQIKAYVEPKMLISPTQHAYRARKSCQTAWADLDTKILHALDNGKFVGLLLVDMSAAFNLVDSEVLISLSL